MKKIFAIAMLVLMVFVGSVSATQLPPETPETVGITTTTMVAVDGNIGRDVEFSMVASNMDTPMSPPLSVGEVISGTVYEQVFLGFGDIGYVSEVNANSDNQPDGGRNIDVVSAAALGSGIAYFGDDIALFGAGDSTLTRVPGSAPTICPFDVRTEDTYIVNPPFCSRAIAASEVFITRGDVATAAGVTAIAAGTDVPADLDYSIVSEGSGYVGTTFDVFTIDARGTAERVVRDGHGCRARFTTVHVPSTIVEYHEDTHAIGDFSFAQAVGYRSGI